jgi:hypothetical protein
MYNIQLKIDQLLVKAIDEVLCSLGEPVKNQVYILLEKDFSITKNNLPQQITEFSKLIHRLFGVHAHLIEIKCMKIFYSKMKNDPRLDNQSISFDDDSFTFALYTHRFRDLFDRSYLKSGIMLT